MKIQDMIKYFVGVQAQHKADVVFGRGNRQSEGIIRTYDFVIKKLKEWEIASPIDNNDFKKPQDKNTVEKPCPECGATDGKCLNALFG